MPDNADDALTDRARKLIARGWARTSVWPDRDAEARHKRLREYRRPQSHDDFSQAIKGGIQDPTLLWRAYEFERAHGGVHYEIRRRVPDHRTYLDRRMFSIAFWEEPQEAAPDGPPYCICGQHETAPVEFALNQQGELCVVDQHGILPIATRLSVQIEADALRDELFDRPSMIDVLLESFDALSPAVKDLGFSEVDEASDRYQQSYRGPYGLVRVHRWWTPEEEPRLRFAAHLERRDLADRLIEAFGGSVVMGIA